MLSLQSPYTFRRGILVQLMPWWMRRLTIRKPHMAEMFVSSAWTDLGQVCEAFGSVRCVDLCCVCRCVPTCVVASGLVSLDPVIRLFGVPVLAAASSMRMVFGLEMCAGGC